MAFPTYQGFEAVEKIPNPKLGKVLVRVFDAYFLKAENGFYNTLNLYAKQGAAGSGLWTGYTDPDNTLFFMIPPEGMYHFQIPGNYFEDDLESEAAGLTVSLYVMNAMACETEEDRYIEMYHRLRAYARQTEWWDRIRAAID